MRIKKNNDNQQDLSLINQQYLKELETNSNLFNQKIQNLNNSLLNSEEKNKLNNSKFNTSHKKQRLNNSQIYESNNLKYKFDLTQKDLNTIDINNNINNFTFKKRESEKEMRDNNIIEINKELKKKIKELEKENEYKDYVIRELKERIKENDKDKKININYLEYNQLILDIEDKNHLIQKLKNVIKCLKLKNENLIIDIDKLRNENIKLKRIIDDSKKETDTNNINYLNYMKEIKELDLENKKLNIEMLNLNNKYNEIKEEKDKLSSLIQEQSNIIYNYQAQLNKQLLNDEYNEEINKREDKYELRSNLKRKANLDNNIDNNINNGFKNNNYNIYDYEYDYDVVKENNNNNNYNITNKKELNFLENYLSNLLKERCKLENDLIEVNESPRTVSDIKLKSNINDKITFNENEIQKTKNKLKKLRGY